MPRDIAAGVVGEFFVPGRSRTKGSLKPVMSRVGGKLKVHLEEAGEHSKPWKLKMIRTIRNEIVGPKTAPRVEKYPGPVEVRFEVTFDRETSYSDTPWPTDIYWGDGDKLERNLWDALTQSGLILDDRLVVAWAGRKRWTRGNEVAGLRCRVLIAPDGEA